MSAERRIRSRDEIAVMSAADIRAVEDSKERIFLRNLRATIVDVESAQMRREEKQGSFEDRWERAQNALQAAKKAIANLRREKETGEVVMTQSEVDLRDRLNGIENRYVKYMNSEIENLEDLDEEDSDDDEEESFF